MSQFVYAICIIFPSMFIFISAAVQLKAYQRTFINRLSLLFISAGLLMFALRSDGVDYNNYHESYSSGISTIDDPVYKIIEYSLSTLGAPYNAVLLIILAIQIFAVKNLSKFFGVSFAPLLATFCLHLYVVRDLAQFRIGLALYIIFLFLNGGATRRYIGYFLAAGIHLSSFLFSFFYELTLHYSFKSRMIAYVIFFPLLLVDYFWLLEILWTVVPRIQIYINWEQENYGLPISNYNFLLFHCAILLIGFLSSATRERPELRRLLELEALGILIFLIFRDISIFAFRFGNVITTLYPIILVDAICNWRIKQASKISVSPTLKALLSPVIIFIILLAMIFNTLTSGIIDAVRFPWN